MLLATTLSRPGVVMSLAATVAVAMLVARSPVVATEEFAASAIDPAVSCEAVTATTALAWDPPWAVAVRLTSAANRVALRSETSASAAAGLAATAARATAPVVVMAALSAITCSAVIARSVPVSPRLISPVTMTLEPTTSMRAANCGATRRRMASRVFTSTERLGAAASPPDWVAAPAGLGPPETSTSLSALTTSTSWCWPAMSSSIAFPLKLPRSTVIRLAPAPVTTTCWTPSAEIRKTTPSAVNTRSPEL